MGEAMKPAGWGGAVGLRSQAPAALFARIGKLDLRVIELTTLHALASTATLPPTGSIAVLSRNGARVAATVGRADGDLLMLEFDEPLSDWQMAAIAGQGIQGALAA